jgi:signal transduction histidine kinase
VVWLFQVRLIGTFYGNIKKKELEKAADVIESSIAEDTMQSTAYQYAVDYGICVKIYRIEGTTASELVSVDVSGDSVLYNITDKYLSLLYSRAVANGGEYAEKRTKKSLSEEGLYYPMFYFSPRKDEISKEAMEVENTILIRLVTSSDGVQYAIMLGAEMTPVSAVVSMLSLQYIWIAFVLIIGALVLAFIISRNISIPIERMNRAAKQLAAGNYNAKFSGEGFRETKELADTLNYASNELSKNDRLQKELIANISHDLRTPLTMITGYSEVMRDIPGENTPENVQVIIDEATRLSELVTDLLDLSKLQAGTGRLDISRFNLTETVRSTMDRYRKLTERDGYQIYFWSDCEVKVDADRKMILQVLYNLINNAINYTGDDKLVRVDQSVHNGIVRISVTDTGEGIAPEQLPLIWDRYYKVDKVHRRASVGTGIGLSIVKSVLELHGAHYGVDSTPGHGSTFWFELRAAPEEPDKTANAVE